VVGRGERDGIDRLVLEQLAHVGAVGHLSARQLLEKGGPLVEVVLVAVAQGGDLDVFPGQGVQAAQVRFAAPA
jgi:hypothetical protein